MKMLRRVLLTVLGIASFLAGCFGLLMAYASFTDPKIGAAFGAFLLAISIGLFAVCFFALKKAVAISRVNCADHSKSSAIIPEPVKEEPAAAPAPAEEVPAPAPEPVEEEPAPAPLPAEEEPAPTPEPAGEKPAAADPDVSIPKDFKTTSFLVAGIYYREADVIENLLFENPDFEMRKKEIIECCMEDMDIYKYEPFYGHADLVPEPDNPHDPNAIKVVVHGVHIGYVPAKRTKSIKKILDSNNVIEIGCEIYGGPYKVLPYEDADIERGKTDIKSRICIEYK